MAGALDADGDGDGRRRGGRRTTTGPMNRRRFLIGGGIVAAGGRRRGRSCRASAATAAEVPAATGADGTAGAGLGDGADELNVLNWTEYIDLSEDGEVGTVDRFSDETGDLGQLLGDLERQQRGVRQGVRRLPRGRQPHAVGHRHAHVLDGGPAQVEGLAGADPVQPDPELREPRAAVPERLWDPGGKFNLPWQAGVTGFAYNIAETGRELKSINELFDPEFCGRVGFFTEMRDSLGLVMLGMGNDPTTDRGDDQRGPRQDRGRQERRSDPSLHRQRLPPGHPERELRRLHRLVGRHRPGVQPRRAVRVPRGGRDVVVRHDGDPAQCPQRGRRRRSS